MLKRSSSSESNTSDIDLLNQANKAEQQSEDENLLLLEQLVQHESTTNKLILERPYDIGATNLINQKVSIKALNRSSKAISTPTKPIFKFVGLRWLQHNSPKLTTDWLHEQVMFQSSGQSVLDGAAVPVANLASEDCSLELQKLRSQLRWRTRFLYGALGITCSLLLASNTVLSPTFSTPLPATAQYIHSFD